VVTKFSAGGMSGSISRYWFNDTGKSIPSSIEQMRKNIPNKEPD